MLHGVACQRGVVSLNVELHVIFQTVGANKVQAPGGIEIVLVFGWLLGFGFEQELAGEANLLRIIHGHMHELGEMIELALHICVKPALIAFAAAPEHVVFAAQFLGDLEHFLHLTRCVGKDVGVALVAAPCMKRGLLKRLAVPHSSWMPVRPAPRRAQTPRRRGYRDFPAALPRARYRGRGSNRKERRASQEFNEHPRAVLGILHIVRARFPGRTAVLGRMDHCPSRAWCAGRRCQSANGPSWTCPQSPRRRCNA